MGWGQEVPEGKGSGWAGCIGGPTRAAAPAPLPYNQVSLEDALRILNESEIHVSDRNAELPIMTRRGDVCGEIHLGLVKGKWTIRGIFLNRNGPEFMISLKTALEKSGFVVHLR